VPYGKFSQVWTIIIIMRLIIAIKISNIMHTQKIPSQPLRFYFHYFQLSFLVYFTTLFHDSTTTRHKSVINYFRIVCFPSRSCSRGQSRIFLSSTFPQFLEHKQKRNFFAARKLQQQKRGKEKAYGLLLYEMYTISAFSCAN
jgi:hypothetical protein